MSPRAAVVLAASHLLTHVLFAQSAEQAVTQVNSALLTASSKGDKDAYAKLVGDDLRWVQPDGRSSPRRNASR